MNTWNTDDYLRYYAETDDPRIVLVIDRDADSSSNEPDGDALAPAYWLEYGRYDGWKVEQAGSTFEDDEIAGVYANRLNYWTTKHIDVLDRYMRIFHDTVVERIFHSSGSNLLLLNTPAFRQHVGIDNADGTRMLNAIGFPIADEIAYSLDGERAEWQAYLDGDVFGVGYAVNESRTSHDEPVDLDDGDWEVTIECWGFYGEEYAKEAAAEQNLPMLQPSLSDIKAKLMNMTPEQFNMYAQYLYEAVNQSPYMRLEMPMSGKPALVDAIKKAQGRVYEEGGA